MTHYTLEDDNGVAVLRSQDRPIEVFVKNFTDSPAKTRDIRRTTTQTYILDTANANLPKFLQIASYEPNRVRLAVQVIDVAVMILTEVPRSSPDIASVAAGPAPEGRYLPATTGFEYCFYGPDEFYLNALTGAAATRVTVTKEYC